MDEYTPIERYGVIGNLETCGLIDPSGSIDWLCLPMLESPSVFAALLDSDSGGRFSIRPAEDCNTEQAYVDRTNVLETRFTTDDGAGTLTDFMPLSPATDQMEPEAPGLYRRLTCTSGTLPIELLFDPQFDYASDPGTVTIEDTTVVATGGGSRVTLSLPDQWCGERAIETGGRYRTRERITEDETHWFVLGFGDPPTDRATCSELLSQTIEFWRSWVHDCQDDVCTFHGPYHEAIVRSELALKLLTRRDTGAIAAAATTSLPETIGGARNWDYRYSWIRDSAFTVRAYSVLGHITESREYLSRYLDIQDSYDPADIPPLYPLEWEGETEERTLDQLSGYRDSSPVRVGNGAADQLQLDTYGELVVAIAELIEADPSAIAPYWDAIKATVTYICDNWQTPDAGIWEVRRGRRQFVYSKVMCWAGIDRAIQIATSHDDFDAPLDRWRDERAEIHQTVLDRGYNDSVDSFTQTFESTTIDATCLLFPLLGFVDPTDPRMERSIERVLQTLTTDDGLVYRYEASGDEFEGQEGAFVLCSFWLVMTLVECDRVETAREIFDSVLEYCGPLGLFAEEIDPETGRHLGNFPQAFSHIGVINAALYLRRAETDESFHPLQSDG